MVKQDIRFVSRTQTRAGVPASDNSRDWAFSVRQPMASLLVGGVIRAIARPVRPAIELYRCDLFVHAGSGDVPYKLISPRANDQIKAHFGVDYETIRRGGSEADGAIEIIKGAVIGRARLICAFKLGMIIDGCAHACPKESSHARAIGGVGIHSGQVQVIGARDDDEWIWVFESAETLAQPEFMPGTGGVFDLQAWREIQNNKTARRVG